MPDCHSHAGSRRRRHGAERDPDRASGSSSAGTTSRSCTAARTNARRRRADLAHVHADPYDEASFTRRARRGTGTPSSRCTAGSGWSRRPRRGHCEPLRVGGRRSRVPRVDERLAARPARAAGARCARTRALVDDPATRRQGLSHRPHGAGRVRRASERRALPLSVPLRPVPAGAARVVRSCGASSTAGGASSSPTTASRCTTTATPRTARPRSSRRSSSRSAARARSSTSATRRCSRSAR